MANLEFFHKVNYTGETISNLFKVKFKENFTSSVIDIDNISYMHFKILNPESEMIKIMNSQQSIKNCLNTENTAAIFELNNIVYGNKNTETIIKSYDILICNMSILSIRQGNINEPKSPDKYIRESECLKAAEFGKKAVYLMGLDYAMITIVQTGKRKYKVLHIDPSPVIRKKDLNLLILKLESIYNYDYSEDSTLVKLGADPEFMLFNSKSGKMIAASNFFPREGIVGCDNIRIPNRQQRPVAEIRPTPDLSPHKLTANIKDALRIANKLAPYRNIKWVAGSNPTGNYSIGGHIHFSNITLNFSLLRALDNYVGIPIFLIENPISAVRRRKKYGLLADFRVKEYGGFEYRTPGSWLVSPQVALAVLCLAKVVATHHIQLTKNYLDNYEAQAAFYQGNQDYFKQFFESLWSSIASTETYSKYSSELNIIFHMVTNNITWDEKRDFRETWKITAHAKRHYRNTQQTSGKVIDTTRRLNQNTFNNISTILQSRNNPANDIARTIFIHRPAANGPPDR